MPHILDDLARDEPYHVLYCVPRSEEIEDGFREVSAQTFANAVNRTAHWIERELGRSDTFNTIAYAGPRASFHMPGFFTTNQI